MDGEKIPSAAPEAGFMLPYGAAVAGAALLAIALGFGASGSGPESASQPASMTESSPATDCEIVAADNHPEIEAPAEPPRPRASATLGQGGTLDDTLERLGVSGPAKHELLLAAQQHLDLRRLSPSTGITVVPGGEGRPETVAIRVAPQRLVQLVAEEPQGSGYRGEQIVLPVRTEVELTSGIVESSVDQALSAGDHGARLTPAFAEIFQWAIDLLVEPRTGDEIRVAYEVERLGELPDPLPPFGERVDEPGEFLGIGRVLAASYSGRIASASAFWVEGADGDGNYYDESGEPLRRSFLKSPLNYKRISSRFSRARRHPVTRKVVPHHGVDFAAPSGTPVSATAEGRVISTGWAGALGRAVKIRHGSEYVTVYGHLKGVARGIRSGADVAQNQVIGYVGSTGRATGPHLHYTMLRSGKPIDPMRFKNPPAEPMPPALHPAFVATKTRWGSIIGTPTGEVVAENNTARRSGP